MSRRIVLGVFNGVAHRLLGTQVDLLRRVRGLRLLFLAAFGSGLGTWLAFVALTIDVWDRTGSGTWVSALLIADFLPAIVLGLTMGPLVDRLSRRRVMIAADLVRFLVFCALPFAQSATQIVVLAAVAGFATGFFRPAVYAGLPNLVKDSELPSAQGMLQASDAMTTVLGPLAGGVLVAATGPDWAYAINSVTFLFSAALILRIPARLLQVAQATTEGHWRDVAEGLPDSQLPGPADGAHRVERGHARERRNQRRRDRARQGLVRARATSVSACCSQAPGSASLVGSLAVGALVERERARRASTSPALG